MGRRGLGERCIERVVLGWACLWIWAILVCIPRGRSFMGSVLVRSHHFIMLLGCLFELSGF